MNLFKKYLHVLEQKELQEDVEALNMAASISLNSMKSYKTFILILQKHELLSIFQSAPDLQ